MKEQNEKQAIEEMAKIAFPFLDIVKPEFYDTAIHGNIHVIKPIENLYNAGYRKQSAVIDDFAKRLKEKMNDLSRMEYNCVPYFLVSKSFIDKIAAEMKGGAE